MNDLTITQASRAHDYHPNSMPVAKAREFIHRFLAPVDGVLRVPVRTALGRVLAEDILSPVDVPAHRNSAMDGWAMRAADLDPAKETTLTEIGASVAGKPFGGKVAAGLCTPYDSAGGVAPGSAAAGGTEAAEREGHTETFSRG